MAVDSCHDSFPRVEEWQILLQGLTILRKPDYPRAAQGVPEVKLAPQDVDHVSVGQQVHVRFSAFSQRNTPELNGIIASVAADLTADERSGQRYYVVRAGVLRGMAEAWPEKKQRELACVVEIIHEEFEDALRGGEAEFKKKGRIWKIILFGSYARGTWVDEPHTTKGYRSDYDIPIIHSRREVGDALHLGQPFFLDIRRDGIILYEFDQTSLPQPRMLSNEEIAAVAQSHFNARFHLAVGFLEGACFI